MKPNRTLKNPHRASLVGMTRRDIARVLARSVSAEGVTRRGITRLVLFEEMVTEAMALVECQTTADERERVVAVLRQALAHAEANDPAMRPFFKPLP